MLDDWLLEHLAKVTTFSCVLIVLYFLVYSIWRITQMPNYPWNWNEWQWPIGGRHAVEIIRNRTEMPFTLSLVDKQKDHISQPILTLNYLKDKVPPDVTVLWGPAVSYLMHLINSPWSELTKELMMAEVEPGQWKCIIQNGNQGESDEACNRSNYFILQRLEVETVDCDGDFIDQSSDLDIPNVDSYKSVQLVLKPPVDFDWTLLKNQFRYPAAIFITNYRMGRVHPGNSFEINGIVNIAHVRNDVFPKPTASLAQYIKMTNGQCHILQSLFVMDDHRADEDDDNLQDPSEVSEPFNDILCSVCQVSPVTRVIIPCRHLCLCTQCFEKVEICPICRGAIMYYFKIRQDPHSSTNLSYGNQNHHQSHNPTSEDSQNLTWWQRVERWNERFSYASGLIRQY